jgi:hypothetical protein
MKKVNPFTLFNECVATQVKHVDCKERIYSQAMRRLGDSRAYKKTALAFARAVSEFGAYKS